MKTIPLTQGLFAKVDDDDFRDLSQFKWHAFRGSRNRTFYAARTIKGDGKKKTVWMHRVIAQTPDGMITDHLNGDGLDNRKINLRVATHRENMINNAGREGRTLPRGVSWHKSNECWVAQITVDGKNRYIGRFDTVEAAASAYQSARAKLRAGETYRR